jgi:hypothetical protein
MLLIGAAAVVCLHFLSRSTQQMSHYVFGFLLGTVLAVGVLKVVGILVHPSVDQNGFLVAFGIMLLIFIWRLLFGRWDMRTKATVLGTFLGWVVLQVLLQESGAERLAHFIAIAVAIIPAVIWIAVFLPYHRERLSVVLSMFFAGMLSTIPILFYDALVKRGMTLNFLLFRIELQSFSGSARMLVGDLWPTLSSVTATGVSVFVSFLVVGFIEEGSKMWVLRRAGNQYTTSIDDFMQMAVLVAIGFAFAENIVPTGYFVTFAKEYLLKDGHRDWMAFVGNVAGRSVLTSMVHIVSTGIFGYFMGLATFAAPHLREMHARGYKYRVLGELHRIFGMREQAIFQRQMLIVGFSAAIFLHALSNFIVTIPEILPNNPRTVGDIMGADPGSPLHFFSLLLVPTLVYVVGGFVLLTTLFTRKENMKVRGRIIPADMFVSGERGM